MQPSFSTNVRGQLLYKLIGPAWVWLKFATTVFRAASFAL